MPGLILKLRAHEQILVNGVVMQNGDRNARLIIKTPDAEILRLRDAIHPEDATTPVRRVCYLAQLAVAGDSEPEDIRNQLVTGITQLRDALQHIEGAENLEHAMQAVEDENYYSALKYLRKLIPVEEMLLGAEFSTRTRQNGYTQ